MQTFLAKKAATYLSGKLHTRVEIGSLDIQFFKQVVLADVFIQDLHHDTLFYSQKLKVGIDNIDFNKQKLHFGSLTFLNAKAKLIKYKKEKDFNFQFLIDAFKSADTTKKNSAPWDIKFGGVTFVNTAFVYRSEDAITPTSGMNYFDIDTRSINGQIDDIRFVKDTIFGTINYLAAREKCGFILNNLSSYVKVSSAGIELDELKIKTPESNIATDLAFIYSRYQDFLDYNNKVIMKGNFDHSVLQMSDISYFAPALKGVNKKLTITGKIKGSVSDIRGKDMDIIWGGVTRYKGDVSLTGLPDIESTIFYFNIKNFSTNYYDLMKVPIPPFISQKTLVVPNNIAKLGIMEFKGTFTGLYNDFYSYGTFSSMLGRLSTDLSLTTDSLHKNQIYKGKIKSYAFDFGNLFDIKKLGKITADLRLDGVGLTYETVAADLKGTVNSIELNNYTYQNIAVEGNVENKIFKGKLKVSDENIDLDFNGKVDFKGKLPRLDFTAALKNTDLAALHFINSTKKTNLSTKINVDLSGNTIDNINGEINFDSTIYVHGKDKYNLHVFNLVSKEENDTKTLTLKSDFLNGDISGTFKVLELPLSINNLLSNYLPSYFKQNEKTKNIAPQNFNYNLVFDDTKDVTQLFFPDIKIAPKSQLKGSFNSVDKKLTIDGNSDKLFIKGISFKNWNLNVRTNGEMIFNTGCEKLFTSDSTWLTDFKVSTKTHTDSVNLAITWDNKKENLYKGDIKAFLNIDSRRAMKFKFLPSYFVVADSSWSISKDNEVHIDSSYITVRDVAFEHGNQSYALNGTISNNKTDQIKLMLANFNLANLNLFTKNSGLFFRGTISGESTISDFYHDLLFVSDNTFKSVFLNDNEVGDGHLSSKWDANKEAMYVNGAFSLGIVPNILFSGNYYPKKEEDNIDLKLNFEALNMQLFEPFVKKYCSSFRGFFAGNVNVTGSIKKPLLSGLLNVNAKKITVDYLNTTYNFSHQIKIDNNSFGCENMEVNDIYGNRAVVNGKLYHENFRNFQLDFDISAYKFMCLNTTEADNGLYYGKGFITGIVNIFGYLDNISIDANVKTEKISPADKGDKTNILSKTEITQIFIPLSKSSDISENSFITYIKKDSSLTIKKDEFNLALGGLTLNFDLDVTPDAEVQLIFDQKAGDIIKANGSGDISLRINSKGDFKMFGEYVIEKGDYLFTLQNVINKRFDLQNGGTIHWSGVPYRADMNLSAIYKTRASLAPFFDSTAHIDTKKRYPVDLKLQMNGDLLSPEISFDINLPTVEPTVQQTVLSYINSDAERNRQVFSLLILNSFVTPYQLAGNGASLKDQTTAGAGASTSELLSNQLSNMLSKVSRDFDVGIHYRPGDAVSKDEVSLALSTQLFDERLTIDGNVSNSQNAAAQANNNIISDVNMEYKITNDGKVRIRAFNKANDISNSQVYASGPYTQGVGIFYREEFDYLGDLFLRYLNAITPKKKRKPEAN